jgi:hypothetical protein
MNVTLALKDLSINLIKHGKDVITRRYDGEVREATARHQAHGTRDMIDRK